MRIGNHQGRRFELIDKDEHRDIALHHLIRIKGKQFARKILEFDQLFKTNKPEDITDEKVN